VETWPACESSRYYSAFLEPRSRQQQRRCSLRLQHKSNCAPVLREKDKWLMSDEINCLLIAASKAIPTLLLGKIKHCMGFELQPNINFTIFVLV
jgi:hypothetical protein